MTRFLAACAFTTVATAVFFACPTTTTTDDGTPTPACGSTLTTFNAEYPDLVTEQGSVPDFSCCTDTDGVLCPKLDPSRIDPSKIGAHQLNAIVLDFSEDEAQAGAFVKVWQAANPGELVNPGDTPIFDSKKGGSPATDATGTLTIDDGDGLVQSCVPFGYESWTEFQPERTKHTIETGVVLPPDPAGGIWEHAQVDNAKLLSVSTLTYELIPLALGINPRPGTGVAAGSLQDCNGDLIEGAQLLVVPTDFQYGDDLRTAVISVFESEGTCNDVFIRYFRNETPDRTQQWTSDDGIYGAIDVPVGQWRLLVFGKTANRTCADINPDFPDLCPVAERDLFVIADSVNIANSHVRQYPDACLMP